MQHSIKVWDILVRLFHWSLVLFFSLAYLTGEGELENIHALIGYLIAGLIGLRLIWGDHRHKICPLLQLHLPSCRD